MTDRALKAEIETALAAERRYRFVKQSDRNERLHPVTSQAPRVFRKGGSVETVKGRSTGGRGQRS